MFTHLVTPSGAKVAHDVGDLAAYAHVDEAAARDVTASLVEERILRPVEGPEGDGSRVEVFHDVLASAVAAWGRDHEAARALEAERAEARRRHRRLLVVAVVAIVALAAMTLVAAYALVQKNQADDERANARAQASSAHARALIANAISIRATNPVQGLRLAAAAAAVEQTPQIEDGLRRALIESHQRAVFGDGDPAIVYAGFNPNSSRVLTADPSGVTVARRDATLVVRLPHKGVTRFAYRPDGALLVTIGGEVARVWTMPAGRPRFGPFRHHATVNDLSISPSGPWVATAAEDGLVRIWGLRTGVRVKEIRFGSPVRHVSYGPTGGTVLAVGGGHAKVFEPVTGDLVADLTGRGGVTTAKFSPAGRLVVTAAGKEARVWDINHPGFPLYVLRDHTHEITDVGFSPDGTLFATASADQTARIVSTANGQTIAILFDHVNLVRSVEFSPDSQYVVTASKDRTAMVAQADGPPVATLAGHKEGLLGATFSPDGKRVLTWSRDGTARLWDYQSEPELDAGRHGVPAKAKVVSLSPSGRLAATVDGEGVARLVDLRTGRVRPLTRGVEVRTATIGPGGSVLTGETGGNGRLWSAKGRLLGTFPHGATVGATAISADGSLLLTAGKGGARIWRRTGPLKPVRELRTSAERVVTAAAFSNDGQRVALGDGQGLVTVWDLRTGKRPIRLDGHENNILSLEFSRDGTRLVSGSLDHDARVWNLSTGEDRLLSQNVLVSDASFSPDGRWVVTAGSQRVWIWQTRTGTPLFKLRGLEGTVLAATFSPDGSLVRAADTRGSVGRYRCDVCGGMGELRALAATRLKKLGSTPPRAGSPSP
jgi:WD40 repeat protein